MEQPPSRRAVGENATRAANGHDMKRLRRRIERAVLGSLMSIAALVAERRLVRLRRR